MTDLVKKLRQNAATGVNGPATSEDMRRAADEIERLRLFRRNYVPRILTTYSR